MSFEQWKPLCSHEGNLLAETLWHIKPKVIYDLGANTGGWIHKWREAGAEKIICFEPVRELAESLRLKFPETDVRILPLGISDHCHSVENLTVFNAWSLAENGSRRDQVPEFIGKPGFKVDFISLDSIFEYLYDFGMFPQFIKMDIDGAEFRALKGGQKMLKALRPPIYFEFSHLPKFIYGEDPQAMCELIYDLGYQAVSLDGWKCPSADEMMKYYPEGSSYDIMLLPV
jgi:FkbM family methyltransferase